MNLQIGSYNNFRIKFNNFEINFNKRLPNFKKYDTIESNKKLKLFTNFYLPIEFKKVTYKEKKLKYKKYTEEELSEIATKQLEEDLEKEIEHKEKILNKQVNIYPNEGYIEVEVIYEVLENIGIKEKIIF